MSENDKNQPGAAETDHEAKVQESEDETFSGTAQLDPALVAKLRKNLAAQQSESVSTSQGPSAAPPVATPPGRPAPKKQREASGDFEGTEPVDAALVEQLKKLVTPFDETRRPVPPPSASPAVQRTAASSLAREEDQFGGTSEPDAGLLAAPGAKHAEAPFPVRQSAEVERTQQQAASERLRLEEDAKKAEALARAAEQEEAERAAAVEAATREAAARNAEQRARYKREQAEAKAAELKRKEEAKRRKIEQRKKERGSVFSTLGRKKK